MTDLWHPTTAPEFLPLLRRGAGRTPADGGCLVQVAGRLADDGCWDDRPPSVHPVLREAAVRVNDRMPDGARDRLYPLAADLADTATPAPGVAAGLALWAARHVLPRLGERWRSRAELAVGAGYAVRSGVGSRLACRAAGRSAYRAALVAPDPMRSGLLAAAHAAYAAMDDRYAVSAGVPAAAAAAAAVEGSPAALLEFLEGLLAEHRRLAGPGRQGSHQSVTSSRGWKV